MGLLYTSGTKKRGSWSLKGSAGFTEMGVAYMCSSATLSGSVTSSLCRQACVALNVGRRLCRCSHKRKCKCLTQP